MYVKLSEVMNWNGGQGRRLVLKVQYSGSGGRKSPQESGGKAPVKGLGTKSPEADDVLWINVIRMDFGERFKAFMINTDYDSYCVMCRGPASKNFSSYLLDL